MDSLLALFCQIDDFCQAYEPYQQAHQLPEDQPKRKRKRSLCLSEVMTLLVAFHQSGYRTFKDFYLLHVRSLWQTAFPGLVSYSRFIEFIPSALQALCVYLPTCFGECSGVSYIDSTALPVCHNLRISRHRVFAGVAARGKTSMGWFFGFKLHLIVNHLGELLGVRVTPGNRDDRKPVLKMANGLFGKLFGDRGYLSQKLTDTLREQLKLFLCTRRQKRQKPMMLLLEDKLLLNKRGMIESVIDCLKDDCLLQHTRHRSVANAFTHLVAGLVAYCHRPNKPTILAKGVFTLKS